MIITRKFLVLIVLLTLVITACNVSSETTSSNNNTTTNNSGPTPIPPNTPTFRIVSGSENQTLETIIKTYGHNQGIAFVIDYLGSVDIKLLLENNDTTYDAVWPANSLWISLGDQSRRVKYSESIMRSPVALGVKRSVAEQLGWIGKTDITVKDIFDAAESSDLNLMMTSATQSNSGSSAYFGFLYAAAGKTDELLTSEDLNNPEVQSEVRRFLSTFDRSSSSSGFLKTLFLNQYARFDGMFNYEAVLIETNQELVRLEQEPLYIVYPVDGLAIADSPLGYVDQGNAEKEQIFLDLQAYLLSNEVQQQLLTYGRRVGIGSQITNADTRVFNPDWGIDVNRILTPIRFPNADIIEEALTLYQTTFRKPSFTIYVLDYSGSMTTPVDPNSINSPTGESQLKDAMRTLLNQGVASEYLLQAAEGDVTIVIPFSDNVLPNWQEADWRVEGNDTARLNALLDRVVNTTPMGGTNIYAPAIRALEIMAQEPNLNRYFPSIILMTDGETTSGMDRLTDLQQTIQETGLDYVPIFTIMFGAAKEDEVKAVADYSSARVYDGRTNLIEAFRSAKGNN